MSAALGIVGRLRTGLPPGDNSTCRSFGGLVANSSTKLPAVFFSGMLDLCLTLTVITCVLTWGTGGSGGGGGGGGGGGSSVHSTVALLSSSINNSLQLVS